MIWSHMKFAIYCNRHRNVFSWTGKMSMCNLMWFIVNHNNAHVRELMSRWNVCRHNYQPTTNSHDVCLDKPFGCWITKLRLLLSLLIRLIIAMKIENRMKTLNFIEIYSFTVIWAILKTSPTTQPTYGKLWFSLWLENSM